MFSKMTQALILSGCLVAAGAASASERNVIVPVIAGAAVGAVVATVISNANHGYQRSYYQDYRPQPRYQPVYQSVAYVPVERVEYRRFAPPPPHGYYNRGYDRGYGQHFDQYRGDRRW